MQGGRRLFRLVHSRSRGAGHQALCSDLIEGNLQHGVVAHFQNGQDHAAPEGVVHDHVALAEVRQRRLRLTHLEGIRPRPRRARLRLLLLVKAPGRLGLLARQKLGRDLADKA